MDEAEARDTLERLSAALSEGGADWIVRQVSAAVQEGRTQEKVKVRRPRGRPSLHPVEDEESKRRPTGEFTRSLPYSPQEQLALLTEAIRGVFVESASLNGALVKEFGNITFQSEGRFAEEETFVIDEAAVASHAQAEARVTDLIAKLMGGVEQ
jgi:hypothetical protein